jgi:hypothetical protein
VRDSRFARGQQPVHLGGADGKELFAQLGRQPVPCSAS